MNARVRRHDAALLLQPPTVDTPCTRYPLQDNPDMAIDVLRSGLSHPAGGPVDTARLQLALATIEAERNNWVSGP